MDHPAFKNQDLLNQLSTSEFMQLSNLKEMRRSLAAVVDYLEREENAIFQAARSRQGGEPNVQVD
jgi:hypothetical protein